jgi:hypothetical protein
VKIDEHIISELESRVNTEHQKDIAAIKRVLRLIRKNKLVPQSAIKTRDRASKMVPAFKLEVPSALPNGHSALDQIETRILETIAKFPGQFTFSDLVQALTVSFPDQQFDRKVVSASIFKNKEKRIHVVQEGWGRKKAIYEKM